MTVSAFIAIGSNLGDRPAWHRFALQRIAGMEATSIVASTSPQLTEPIGPPGQDSYLNAMVLVHTTLRPDALLDALQGIEDASGRERSERWGPRTLDLDIILFGDERFATPRLTVPHPEIAHRPFWMRELAMLLPRSWTVGLPEWAEVSDGRRGHIEQVAGTIAAWAWAAGVECDERQRWVRAAYLHDAMKDAEPERLRVLSDDAWGMPPLHHGPAAARMAADLGEMDRGVLDAVRYHTVGYVGWDRVGRMLYLADYLEPSRPFHDVDRDEVFAVVPHDPDAALVRVAMARREYVVSAGFLVPEETVTFWQTIGVAHE